MKSKCNEPNHNVKEKSLILKKNKTKIGCPFVRIILSILKNSTTSKTHLTVHADKKMESESTLKNTKKKTRIIRLPKNGYITPFLLTLFNDLSSKGMLQMDACDITRSVNIISNAKMDLDGGKPWNGKIKIAENLHLKLYTSGLVLHLKH